MARRTPAPCPAKGAVPVIPWITLTRGTAKLEARRFRFPGGEATVPEYRDSLLASRPTLGTAGDAFPRLPRTSVHRDSLESFAKQWKCWRCCAQCGPHAQPRILRAGFGGDRGHPKRPSAPPGGPAGRLSPAAEDLGKTRPPEGNCSPGWSRPVYSPTYATPPASSSPGWPPCAVAGRGGGISASRPHPESLTKQ